MYAALFLVPMLQGIWSEVAPLRHCVWHSKAIYMFSAGAGKGVFLFSFLFFCYSHMLPSGIRVTRFTKEDAPSCFFFSAPGRDWKWITLVGNESALLECTALTTQLHCTVSHLLSMSAFFPFLALFRTSLSSTNTIAGHQLIPLNLTGT